MPGVASLCEYGVVYVKGIPENRRKAGQAMVEFTVVAGVLLATIAIFMFFLGTFGEYGGRILDLVGSEYP
jgi:hypothetical protein